MKNKNQKLEFVSFLAMLCVVWWHCFCGSTIERWFIPSVCVWAVPWFFFLSGVLFKKSLEMKSTVEIAVSKTRSLFVPYICWCLIGAVITLTSSAPYGNRALWYVRTLMIFMSFTIFINFCFQRVKARMKDILVPIFVFVTIIVVSRFLIKLGPSSSGLYFSAGMLLSPRILTAKRRNVASALFLGIPFLLMAIVSRLIWFCQGHDFSQYDGTFLANISTIMLISGIWFLTDIIPPSSFSTRFFKSILPLTSVVYFMHYPINDAIKYLMRGINSNYEFVILLIGAPLFYITVSLIIKSYLSRIYSILSGGR